MTCVRCNGTKTRMGIGFLSVKCDCVDEKNSISVDKISPDKRSKSYRDAIQKIMDINQIGKKEAEKVFDEEYSKLD